MKILYLYIDSYKKLEDLNLNFSENYKFYYDRIKEELSIDRKEINYSLFGNLKINAIIGCNGTGKSSIFNFIVDLEFLNDKTQNYIVVTSEGDKMLLYVNRDNKIYKEELEPIKTNMVNIKEMIIEDKFHKEIKNMNEMGSIMEMLEAKPIQEKKIIKQLVYYSNIFDGNAMMRKSSSKDFYNISTNYLLNESKDYYEDFKELSNKNLVNIAKLLDIKETHIKISGIKDLNIDSYEKFNLLAEELKKKVFNDIEFINSSLTNTFHTYKKNINEVYQAVGNIEELTNPIHYFFIDEFKRQIDLFCYISKSQNDYSLINSVNIPENVIFSVRPNIEAGKLYKKNQKLNSFLIKHWSSTKEYPEELVDYKKNIFHFKLMFSALLYAKDPLNLDKFETGLEEIMKITEDLDKKKALYKLSTDLLNFYKTNHQVSPIHKVMINALEEILNDSSSFIDEEFNLITNLTNETTVVHLKRFLDSLKDLEIKEFMESNVLSYKWDRDMSSGEITIYTLFSRLYELKKELSQKEFILLLDEPDMYLHIEWQRTFIIDLLKFLETEFGNIQVILTSHSPFVISDIPKENIIFLDKEDGKIVTGNPKKLDNTFAANIHNLVKNGFFMPNSTIGEFAKSKIEEVSTHINNGQYQENKVFCDYIISIVGEPLIKNKLLSMIDSQESIQDKINKRKKEIEALEKELNNNDKNRD